LSLRKSIALEAPNSVSKVVVPAPVDNEPYR
jgi:hypothetical protein